MRRVLKKKNGERKKRSVSKKTAERRKSLTVRKQLLQLFVARVVFWKGIERLLAYIDVPIVGIEPLKELQPIFNILFSDSKILMPLGVVATSYSKLEYFTFAW